MLRSVWSVVLLVTVLSILAGCGGAAPAPAPTATTAPKAAPTTAPAAPPTTAPTAAPKAANTTAPTTAPTAAPKAANTAAPTAAPKAANTTAPTAAPKAANTAAPTAAAAPKAGATSADVQFGWAPNSVPPADADDTAIIIQKLQTNDGIIGATGDETGMTVSYNPSLITVEKIIEIFGNMGHPVVKK